MAKMLLGVQNTYPNLPVCAVSTMLSNMGSSWVSVAGCCTLSTHTHGALDERGGQRSHAANPQHSLSVTTNPDSLVEFFIHTCKFVKYSISFSFKKIKFLLSPKIHDYSLTITRDSPAVEVHAKGSPKVARSEKSVEPSQVCVFIETPQNVRYADSGR